MNELENIGGSRNGLDTGSALTGESSAPLEQARILIVDDNASSRLKLSKAVRNFGHHPEAVENGAKGLERLQSGDIDLLLLDIMMPVMDGFEVLKRMKADPRLREVPTLVISGLDEIEETAKAIELGAIDFLPKTFNAVLLRARVNACLERAQQRARELETLHQIEQLTKAADALDSDDLNPMELGIRDIATRPGALGNLSRVLLNKSTMVYNHRQDQAQQIRNLLGVLMLLLIGASYGLKPALAKLHLADIGNPLGVGLYTMGLTAM
jgi:DNA-binding response OmpR family regulator